MTVWVAAALLFSAVQLSSPAPQPPPPPGNRIVAQDGDTVVVDHHARVRIVRSTQANVRAVFNAAEHWVMVLADSLRTADLTAAWIPRAATTA